MRLTVFVFALLVMTAITSVAAEDIVAEAEVGHAVLGNSNRFTPALPVYLKSRLSALGIPEKHVSLSVYSLDNAASLLEFNEKLPRNPASVMKAVTTFAALSALSPGYQWKTTVRRTGLIRNGVLEGDLVLIGQGNPYFLRHDLWQLLSQLESRGIHSVDGDLIIDMSYFDIPEHDAAAFDGKSYRPYNVGPSAVLYNFGAVDFFLVPKKGQRYVDVRSIPALPNLTIKSELRQSDRSCNGGSIKLQINTDDTETGRQVRFTGLYPERCGRYQLTRAVLPSQELLYGDLVTMFRNNGGDFSGSLLLGKSPSNSSKLFTMHSQTLAEIIRDTNKFSNNVMSQQLLLTLGAERFGAPATQDKSIRALRAELSELGISMPELTIANGSGLCRECSVTAEGMQNLLRTAWKHQYMPEFMASMPVPGIDGALKKRFPKGAYKGRVHMKTGTIDHVSAAAGLVQTEADERLVFTLLINHENVHKGKGQAFQRRLLKWLVELERERST